jgi:hypothetical protein
MFFPSRSSIHHRPDLFYLQKKNWFCGLLVLDWFSRDMFIFQESGNDENCVEMQTLNKHFHDYFWRLKLENFELDSVGFFSGAV